MAELKQVRTEGLLKTISDNFAALGPVDAFDGLWIRRTARCTYDLAVAANRTVAAHPMAVTLPANAIVVGGVAEVITAVTGEASATLAVHIQTANDIIAAAAVSGAPWSTQGRKAIVPKCNTPESGIKLTAAGAVTFTVGTAALLTGKVVVYLDYYEGLAPTT